MLLLYHIFYRFSTFRLTFSVVSDLSGESKKKFLEFSNAWSVVNGESNLDSFIMGFRLGAQFTYDTFVNDEAPFMDLLKE